MYYMLEYYSLGKRPVRSVMTFPRVAGVMTWLAGQPFTVPIPEPLVIPLEPGDDEDPSEPQVLFNSTILLMREDLAAALREGGADNFDAYRAVLVDASVGKRWENYVAVNLIGCVAAADLGKSVYNAHGGRPLIDVDFDSVAIDAKKAQGLRLFRLAECMTAVVVHESVKDHLIARGFDSLTFVPSADWVG